VRHNNGGGLPKLLAQPAARFQGHAPSLNASNLTSSSLDASVDPDVINQGASDKTTSDKITSDKTTSDQVISDKTTCGRPTCNQGTSGLAVSERPFSDLPAFDQLPASGLATGRLSAQLAVSGGLAFSDLAASCQALSGDFILCLGGDRKDIRARPDCAEERRHLFQDFISGEG
jgi:hypothetical protein